MSFIAPFIPAIASVAGGLISGGASRSAARTEAASFQAGIDENRRQFDLTRGDLEPWKLAGTQGLAALLALVGLGEPGAQQEAIAGIEGSPMFASLIRQGEEGILHNASATGGLRGGNIQHSLADFRSDTLSELIERQLGRLGGISGTGQQTAAQLGQFGANSAGAIAELLGRQGSARAGGILGGASGWNQVLSGIVQGFGALGGKGF